MTANKELSNFAEKILDRVSAAEFRLYREEGAFKAGQFSAYENAYQIIEDEFKKVDSDEE